LTRFDLTLDPTVRAQYLLSKYLAWALTDHFRVAEIDPSLSYDPYGEKEQVSEQETEEEEEYPEDTPGFFTQGSFLQGLPSGVVDTAAQVLIVETKPGSRRVMRFGEFDKAYDDKRSAVHRDCAPVAGLFRDFHPRTHPVLWRILIMQAQLATTLSGHPGGADAKSSAGTPLLAPWLAIPVSQFREYDWRRRPVDKHSEQAAITDPFNAASRLSKERLGKSSVL
jgi:hypothetical protein